jgi:DNA (cytosine-5)-methyltransferase 1
MSAHRSGRPAFVLDAAEPFIAPDGTYAATMVQTGYGEREGQAPRALDLGKPLGTVVAGGGKHALVAAFLAKHNGGHEATGQPLTQPMHTVMGTDQKALVACHVTKFYGTSVGADLRDPAPTITGQGNHAGLVAAFLTKFYGNATGSDPRDPMHTVTSRDRFGLVTVNIAGEPWAIIDLGMRMLQPRELALAQGFPEAYVLTGSAREQTARIGNSVCPPVAAAVVAALLAPAPVVAPRRRRRAVAA